MNETPTAEDRIMEVLSGVPIFSPLDDRKRRKLAKLCTLKSFEPGEVIFEEETMALSLFIVTAGRVQIYRASDRRKVGLGTVEAGHILGQEALFDDRPRSASAEALAPTEGLLLTRDSFDTLVKKDPEIAWCLVPDVAGRIRELQGLAMEAELEREKVEKAGEGKVKAKTKARAEEIEAKEAKAEKAEEAEEAEEKDEDDDETSDLESAMYKMMRMQYGMIAGAAKGATEMARLMETFLDSMADETDLKTSDDWRDMLEKIPDAMVTATRAVMDEGEKIPDEMVDAYHRYSDEEK